MPLRVVVFITPDDPEHEGVTAIVNPVLELLTEGRVEGWEGCLSVPGLQGVVPRAPKVRYTGVTPRRRARSTARSRGSTPSWCSTSLITWTAFSIPSA